MQVLISDPALIKKLKKLMKIQRRSGSSVVSVLIARAKFPKCTS
jgi:hypothetical protein